MPDLLRESAIVAAHRGVICCDEVGRGALAGPVSIGAVYLTEQTLLEDFPNGLKDSKLISEPKRPEIAARSASWVAASSVGEATAAEIDEFGIMSALSLSASRALAQLYQSGVPVFDVPVLLDGNFNFITQLTPRITEVITVVKGDRDCAGLSAASVIAKVARDRQMIDLHQEFPAYGWAKNKGYASAVHREAIIEHGITPHHRSSWRLTPGSIS